MEFGIDDCFLLIMKKNCKRETTERREQQNQEKTRTLSEKENYK